tara:strand:- start:9697 stop:10194 length:498 start_codon:yes stop_codon:yes gene_type:complete
MDKKKTVTKKLTIRHKMQGIQSSLKAPKGQTNNFGNYNYRSAEGILSALKPLLGEWCCILVSQDQMVEMGGRVYVQTTSTLTDVDTGDFISTTGLAKEAENKKGMDDAQITGSAASYSLKRALGNLFCISDSSLDPDATNTHGKSNTNNTTKTTTRRVQQLDDII